MKKKEDSNIENEIHSVKLYQSVRFAGHEIDFFCNHNKNGKHGKIEISIHDNVGILLTSDKSQALIPFANISSVVFDTPTEKAKREAHAADNAKPAQAQKINRIKSDPVGAKRLA